MMTWMQEFEKMLFPLSWKEVNAEGAFMLKHQHLPTSIFKYREITPYSIKNLEEDTIWLADTDSFNDPYDSGFSISFSKIAPQFFKGDHFDNFLSVSSIGTNLSEEEIELARSSTDPMQVITELLLRNEEEDKKAEILKIFSEIGEKLHNELLDKFKSTIRSSFKICSFSTNPDSTLMWGHYSKNHTGFCMEYDLTSIPYGDYRTRFLYPVIYSDTLFDATEWMAAASDKDFNNLYLTYSALHKANEWSYEQEWRLIFSAGVMDKPQSYPMGRPKAIYLGAMISETEQDNIVNIANSKSIPVFKMELDNHKFRLTPKTLDSFRRILPTDHA